MTDQPAMRLLLGRLLARKGVWNVLGQGIPVVVAFSQSMARRGAAGCGVCQRRLLDLARRRGWRVMGVEPDPDAVEAGRRRGLEVLPGAIEMSADSNMTFDVITLSDVVKPHELLSASHRLLKPGRFLWLETPSIGSIGLADQRP